MSIKVTWTCEGCAKVVEDLITEPLYAAKLPARWFSVTIQQRNLQTGDQSPVSEELGRHGLVGVVCADCVSAQVTKVLKELPYDGSTEYTIYLGLRP